MRSFYSFAFPSLSASPLKISKSLGADLCYDNSNAHRGEHTYRKSEGFEPLYLEFSAKESEQGHENHRRGEYAHGHKARAVAELVAVERIVARLARARNGARYERGDNADERGGGKGVGKLRVLVGDLAHGLLHLLHNEDDENERQDAADSHDKGYRRKNLGVGDGARKSQTEGIERCLRGDALIGEVAYDREPYPRQDDAQGVCEHDDSSENRDGGSDGKHRARHDRILQLFR